jgi:signal transduction histidine kinase
MESLKSELVEVSTNWLPRAIAISNINLTTTDLRLRQLQHAMAHDSAQRQESANIMIGLIDEINAELDTYEKLREEADLDSTYSAQEREIYQRYLVKWEEYQDLSLDFFSLSMRDRDSAAIEMLRGESRVVFDEFSALLVRLVRMSEENSRLAGVRAEMTLLRARKFMTTLFVLSIIVSSIFILVFVRWTTVPIRQLDRAADKIASGDLNVRIEVNTRDEVGCLAVSFNQMATALQEAHEKTERQASALRRQTAQLRESNQEIRSKNDDLEEAMRQLRMTQDRLLLKEKMASLGNLVAGLAHEINNPIGSVLASNDVSRRCVDKLQSALEKADSVNDLRNDPEVTQSLNILVNNIRVTSTAGGRVADIVKSMKNFSRVDESELKVADIHEGIDSSLILLSSEMSKDIRVIKDFGSLEPIVCYPGQLNQVFFNVLRNAIDAVDATGEIKIMTRQDKKSVTIEIADNGRGISQGKLDRIFEFGFTADSSRVKMSSGLKSAYNIIQRHDGEIRVESREGHGTTVFIRLPRK